MGNLSAACNDPTNEKWISKLASAQWLAFVKDVLNAGSQNTMLNHIVKYMFYISKQSITEGLKRIKYSFYKLFLFKSVDHIVRDHLNNPCLNANFSNWY